MAKSELVVALNQDLMPHLGRSHHIQPVYQSNNSFSLFSRIYTYFAGNPKQQSEPAKQIILDDKSDNAEVEEDEADAGQPQDKEDQSLYYSAKSQIRGEVTSPGKQIESSNNSYKKSNRGEMIEINTGGNLTSPRQIPAFLHGLGGGMSDKQVAYR